MERLRRRKYENLNPSSAFKLLESSVLTSVGIGETDQREIKELLAGAASLTPKTLMYHDMREAIWQEADEQVRTVMVGCGLARKGWDSGNRLHDAQSERCYLTSTRELTMLIDEDHRRMFTELLLATINEHMEIGHVPFSLVSQVVELYPLISPERQAEVVAAIKRTSFAECHIDSDDPHPAAWMMQKGSMPDEIRELLGELLVVDLERPQVYFHLRNTAREFVIKHPGLFSLDQRQRLRHVCGLPVSDENFAIYLEEIAEEERERKMRSRASIEEARHQTERRLVGTRDLIAQRREKVARSTLLYAGIENQPNTLF